jgi:DNA-directed RNA polymerase subunit RPC12/RpoP
VNQPLLQMDLRLVALAVLVLGIAVSAIWWVGRRLRGELGPARAVDAPNLLAPPAGVPSQVAKALQARGLASPAQLAKMTEMERHLLFSTMASTINKEAEEEPEPRAASARPFIRPEELPTLYCPTCSYRIERFSSTPPITGKCETCGARVVVRRDGARIMLTVLPADDTEPKRRDLRLDP